MKKAISFILIIIFSISFAACGNDDNDQKVDGDLKVKITVGGSEFTAKLYDNETVKAFANILPMTINMSELNANEKYYYLPENLPAAASSVGDIQAGDIMLWGNSCLVLFYKSFSTSYSYTKIGRIEDVAGLTADLGSGSITVTFSIIDYN